LLVRLPLAEDYNFSIWAFFKEIRDSGSQRGHNPNAAPHEVDMWSSLTRERKDKVHVPKVIKSGASETAALTARTT